MPQQESQENAQADTSRSSNNAIYTLPFDARAASRFLKPALERVDSTVAATQLLILVSDPEAAIALGQIAFELAGPQGIELVPVTAADRAARMIRAIPALAVVGPPSAIRGLLEKSVLKLDQLNTIVLAWADDIVGQGPEAVADIEALMADVPKDTARILVARHMTDELDQLAERYLRRAPRLGSGSATAPPTSTVPIEYLTIAKELRARGLRRLLDALDPPSAAVIVHSPHAQNEARHALNALGYRRQTDPVQLVTGDVPEGTHTLVLYEPPTDASDLAVALAAGPTRILVMVEPREVPALIAFLGDQASPIAMPEAREAARQQHDRLRNEIESVIESRTGSHEMVTLEPLLERHDGLEIAAALLKLLEQERSKRSEGVVSAAARSPRATDPKPRPSGTRVFLSIGSRDGVRAGDIVGALTGEANVPGYQIGRVEIRESHTIVEVDNSIAETIVGTMDGRTLKGRRLSAKIDREPAEREPRGRPLKRESDRGEKGGKWQKPSGRGDRPSGPRSRPSGRGDRPNGPRSRPSGPRPPR